MMQKKKKQREITAIDLFCGAGGLTKGLKQAGIDVRLGVDIDPACEYPYTRYADNISKYKACGKINHVPAADRFSGM